MLLSVSMAVVPAAALGASTVLQPVVETETLTTHQQFAREQLTATIRLYDEHMRVAETGQYLDKVVLDPQEQQSTRSSIAATGAGLMSLVLGAELGVIDDAAEKAAFTLANLLNKDPEATFSTPRSKSGWYKHFIDAYTGEGLAGSKQVFSTIDTAILGVGAFKVAKYFETKAATDPAAREAASLAREILNTTDWGQSARFGPAPGLHQIFRGHEEQTEDRWWSLPFDEYVVLPCLGRAVEAEQGRVGPATKFWDTYLSDVASLPQAEFAGHSVLAVRGKRFTSHFTHQFAYYFCGELGSDEKYRAELNDVMQADKAWFTQNGGENHQDHWWGLGAGSEIKFDKEGNIRYSGYGVQKIGKNPNQTFSPAIMAGFLPAEHVKVEPLKKVSFVDDNQQGLSNQSVPGHSEIIEDLMKLHNRDECRYQYKGLDFLWRCTAHDPSLKVRAVEGVDFSTYMLGLAWFDPAIGGEFFENYSAKVRPMFPEARERRASLK